VANMAGLPPRIIRRAEALLKGFEQQPQKTQPTLFELPDVPEESELELAFKHLNLDDLTPIDALNVLYEWKKKKY